MTGRRLAELRDTYAGRAALILGGGVSLPVQVAAAPHGALRLSCNAHGLRFDADYAVVWDADLACQAQAWGVPVLTPIAHLSWAWWSFERDGVWRAEFTGGLAASLALVFGCDPVLLAGMDCYQGGTYYHDPDAESSGLASPLAAHLDAWRRIFDAHPERAGRVRTMGGPLEAVFPLHEGNG